MDRVSEWLASSPEWLLDQTESLLDAYFQAEFPQGPQSPVMHAEVEAWSTAADRYASGAKVGSNLYLVDLLGHHDLSPHVGRLVPTFLLAHEMAGRYMRAEQA